MVYAYFDYTRLCFKLHKKLRRNQTVTWFIKYHTAFFRKFQSLTRKGAPRMSISYHELKDRILSETELLPSSKVLLPHRSIRLTIVSMSSATAILSTT